MEREQRFEIMAAGPAEPLIAMADRLLEQNNSIEIIKEPRPAVMMLRARDTAQGQIFNLGEAIVTEAQVNYCGETGYLLVMGDNQLHALAGAMCDAAVEGNHPLSGDVLETLVLLTHLQKEQAAAEWNRIAPTAVNFDEMEA
jgi:alpha-D-ribose 1-methylphosphonate 5-triphosphate synthase subunit PhnG